MAVLRIEMQPPVAWVVLDRPDEGNPIDGELVEMLADAWSVLNRDAAVRAIGVAASGPVFSVGTARDSSPARRDFGPKSCGCTTPVLVELAGDVGSGAFQLLGEADVVLAAT